MAVSLACRELFVAVQVRRALDLNVENEGRKSNIRVM
jgi:hypothetical protein